MAPSEADLWTIDLFAPAGAVSAVQEALALFTTTVSAFETEADAAIWHITGYCEEEPDKGSVNAALAVAAAKAGLGSLPDPIVARLEARDWLAENQRSFPLICVGRYAVQSLEDHSPVPAGTHLIRLNAGPAFGSGSHDTTQGCLALIDDVARRRRFVRPADIGCGSGILAIAMAKTWHVPVLAVDIDPVAVETTVENAARNGVRPWIDAHAGAGFPLAGVAPKWRRCDLIVANILAKPLAALAGEMTRRLTRGGTLILSGILAEQGNFVLAHYRARGFRLEAAEQRGPWLALQLTR